MRPIAFVLFGVLFTGCQPKMEDVLRYREEYKHEFLNNPRSPLQEADLVNLDFYPPSAKAVIEADFLLTPEQPSFELPLYSGKTRTYRQYGVATFDWKGKKQSLRIYENMTLLDNPVYSDYLFLPFTDETNSAETYGGGRYLDMSKQDALDGHITIDFNRCYNPWCAYSEGYNCPIPPKANDLPFPVRAGERKYKGHIKGK